MEEGELEVAAVLVFVIMGRFGRGGRSRRGLAGLVASQQGLQFGVVVLPFLDDPHRRFQFRLFCLRIVALQEKGDGYYTTLATQMTISLFLRVYQIKMCLINNSI